MSLVHRKFLSQSLVQSGSSRIITTIDDFILTFIWYIKFTAFWNHYCVLTDLYVNKSKGLNKNT